MIDRKAFASGMALLAMNFNREPSQERTDLYYKALGGRLNTEQWETAVRAVLETETFYPPVAVLLKYGAPLAPPSSRAGEVYSELCEAYENLTGREKQWSPNANAVEARWGRAARAAFLASGGVAKFQWCEPDDEPFRLKAFKEAFVEMAEQSPALALPPGADLVRS